MMQPSVLDFAGWRRGRALLIGSYIEEMLSG